MTDPYIQKAIDELRADAAKKLADAAEIETKLKEFPDLKRYVGRWNKTAYYSMSVNGTVNDFDRRFNCGCCADSPLEVWPYKDTPHGRIYSDPPSFMVGTRDYELGTQAYPGWEHKMRDAGISEAVIERVARHLEFREEEEDPP